MQNFFFDTSVLSKIAISSSKDLMNNTKDLWNFFSDQVNEDFPSFVNNNFLWVASTAFFLEFIGLGQQRNGLKKLVNNNEWQEFIDVSPEKGAVQFCDRIKDRIDKYIKLTMSSQILYRKAYTNFLRNNYFHEHAWGIERRIKKWAKSIRNKESYNKFFVDLFLDTIFRYPFINIKMISQNNRLQAMKLWAAILGHLFKNYYDAYVSGFECSVLGLFAELHKTCASYTSNRPDEEKYDSLLRTWDDMADVDSVSFALLGKKNRNGINEPVHVFTCDDQNNVERRVLCLAKNLKEMTNKGFNISFCPGSVRFFDAVTMTLKGVLIVKECLEENDLNV